MKVKCLGCGRIVEKSGFYSHTKTKICQNLRNSPDAPDYTTDFDSSELEKKVVKTENKTVRKKKNDRPYIEGQLVTARDIPTEIWSMIAEILNTSKQVRIIDKNVEIWDFIDYQLFRDLRPGVCHPQYRKLKNVDRDYFLENFPNVIDFKFIKGFNKNIVINCKLNLLNIKLEKTVTFGPDADIKELIFSATKKENAISLPKKCQIVKILNNFTVIDLPENLEVFNGKYAELNNDIVFPETLKELTIYHPRMKDMKLPKNLTYLHSNFLPKNFTSLNNLVTLECINYYDFVVKNLLLPETLKNCLLKCKFSTDLVIPSLVENLEINNYGSGLIELKFTDRSVIKKMSLSSCYTDFTEKFDNLQYLSIENSYINSALFDMPVVRRITFHTRLNQELFFNCQKLTIINLIKYRDYFEFLHLDFQSLKKVTFYRDQYDIDSDIDSFSHIKKDVIFICKK
jgi:hypothetical protein